MENYRIFLSRFLKCFVKVTIDISSEKNVTISKLIVLSNLILQYCENEIVDDLPTECKNMQGVMQEQIKKRFQNIENYLLLAETTFSDPRFKRYGFQRERKQIYPRLFQIMKKNYVLLQHSYHVKRYFLKVDKL